MANKSPENQNQPIGQLGANDDEYMGINRDFPETLANIPSKMHEATTNAIIGLVERLPDYARDFAAAIKAGRDSISGPRP